jgi:hypothetical protein
VIESQRVDNFLNEIIKVCKKYDLSISHEDHHGAFEIEDLDEYNLDWLSDAHITQDCRNYVLPDFDKPTE